MSQGRLLIALEAVLYYEKVGRKTYASQHGLDGPLELQHRVRGHEENRGAG